ncbi:MAG TPA: hypothetical protein VIJ75_05975 [Hanamia sp.]
MYLHKMSMSQKISLVTDMSRCLFLALIFYSCAPEITSFTALPVAITSDA